MTDIKLQEDDPTVFAKCPSCCKGGTGVPFGQVYLKAFTKRKWARGPLCENCETPLVRLYEVETE
jgi:hypothetical protein